MATRVCAFYLDMRQQRQHASDNVIVICHAGIIRFLLAYHSNTADRLVIKDIAQQAASKSHAIAHGHVTLLFC